MKRRVPNKRIERQKERNKKMWIIHEVTYHMIECDIIAGLTKIAVPKILYFKINP